jgi:hypothetical protein
MNARTLAARRAKGIVYALLGLASFAIAASPSDARAGSKEACVEAHGRGQDLRDRGQLTSAKQAFMACAQSSCPTLIQGDCARFAEEVERLLPSVSFAARDDGGTDLPTTTVFVDGVMVTMRLDDGRSFELDPGKHVIRFSHAGRDSTLEVVLNQGEKGRTIVATFVSPKSATQQQANAPKQALEPRRPTFPLVIAGAGAAAIIAGGTLFVLGSSKLPSNCSMSTHDCAAPPGDNAFNEAHSAASMMNLGVGVGAVGAAALVSGLVWYWTRSPSVPAQEKSAAKLVQPWIGKSSGGVSIGSTF